MTVRFTENRRTVFRIRWDRVGAVVAAVLLIVIGWNVFWGMLILASEPLPECTRATITHVCSGHP